MSQSQIQSESESQSQKLVLPPSQFYNFFTAHTLVNMCLNRRLKALVSHDPYRDSPVPSHTIKAFTKLTKCDVFAIYKDRIYEDYLKEYRFRTLFKKLLYHWRVKFYIRNSKEGSECLDPITFLPIENPIMVYDTKQKRRFQFEAQSLAIAIRKNLYFQQYGVPQPKRPINLITNRSFTNVQMISIHHQLTRQPIRIDDYGTFRRLEFNIERWKLFMFAHLQMAAYREELYDYHSENGQDMIHDYIMDMMCILDYSPKPSFKAIVLSILVWWPDHPIIETIRQLCLKSYEADYFLLSVKPILLMRFKKVIDSLWPKSELLDRAYAKKNAMASPNVDEDGDTYMEDMEELND